MVLVRHELAHTIRQSYDGSFLHFLYDAIRFGYIRRHGCDLSTNEGDFID